MSETVPQRTENAKRHEVKVSRDRMMVHVSVAEPVDDPVSLAQAILLDLESMGIERPPERERLVQLIGDRGRSNLDEGILVAQGQAPTPPRHGALIWAQDFFHTGFVEDRVTGMVDYRRHTNNLAVVAGQLLAHIIHPEEGQEGRDVFGRRVPPERPRRVHVRAGPNVQFDEADGTFVATADGRLRTATDLVAVDEVFTVQGSVGLATGHIRHPGTLIVEKDIEAGAEVCVEGDLEVKGTIEAADVVAGGAVRVWGGIVGAADRRVKAGGSLRAKFIRDAHVEAGESVYVEKELVHSTVRTRGALVAPQGRVVGGEVMALGGIDVRSAGSEGAVATLLIAGDDFSKSEALMELEREAASLQMTLAKIHATVDPLKAQRSHLPTARCEALDILLARLEAMEKRRDELREAIEDASADARSRRRGRVLVRHTIHADVTIGLGGERLHITEPLSGSIQAVSGGGGIRLLPARAGGEKEDAVDTQH